MSDMVRIKNKAFKNAKCKICENIDASIQYKYKYNSENYYIVECRGCGHLYIDPVPLESIDLRAMNTLVDAEFDGNRILKYLHEKLVIKREINNIKNIMKKDDPELLDVGCGTGWTTSIWQKHGFNVTGLEPSQSRYEFGKDNYDVNIINGHLADLGIRKKFDVIVLRHVLEHIEDPGDFLIQLTAHLKDGGVILITIPNINSIGRYMFKENWEWVLPWHLHFFYPKTLKTLIEKTGFESIKLYQIPSPLWYPSSLGRCFGKDSRINKFLSRYPRLSTLILVSPIVLLGMVLGLNDNMTLIAKKDGS
jgi:2-polyprenyl-3-methyl-5-hydroxy-6-metoxy-1,4-benzoquinol methylase